MKNKMTGARSQKSGAGIKPWKALRAVVLLASYFCFLTSASAQTRVTATYGLPQGAQTMTTVGGTAEYGMVFIQRNASVSYNNLQYGKPMLEAYLNAAGQLNDGAGNFFVSLIPNATATPSGTYYVATVNIQGQVHSEIWVVPDQTTVDASLCRQNQPPGASGPVLAYQIIEQSGASLTARNTLNFSGSGVSCADNSAVARTDCTITAGSGGGSGTVTTFSAGNLSPLFTSSVATAATTPALSFSLSTAGAHQFLGNNSAGTAAPQYVQPAFSDLSGTATLAQLPALTCSNLSNAAASCSTDTSNAANISSGTLAAARLPNPSATTLGGTESFAAVAHEWINTISTSGVPSAAQPAFADLAGIASDAQLANAYSGAGACPASHWASTLSRNAAPTCTQPAFSDLSGTAGAAQLAVSNPTSGELSGVSSTNLAAANKMIEKSIVIFTPTAGDSNMVQLYFGQAVTLARIACSTDTGSATINFDTRAESAPNTAGTNVLGSALACTTTTGTTSTFSSSAVSADAPLNLQIASVSGSPNAVRIHVKATVN